MQTMTLTDEYEAAQRVLDADAVPWLAEGVRDLVATNRARWEPDPDVAGCVGLREVGGAGAVLIVVWIDREDFEESLRLEEILEGLS